MAKCTISDLGLTALQTRNLQQDCLEHFFAVIRNKGGNRENPTAQQFRCDYRQAVLDYLNVVGKNTNCDVDESHVLLQLSNLFEVQLCKNVD